MHKDQSTNKKNNRQDSPPIKEGIDPHNPKSISTQGNEPSKDFWKRPSLDRILELIFAFAIVIFTFFLMRTTTSQLGAMEDQSKTMRDQLESMKKSFQVSERAYVGIQDISLDMANGRIIMSLQNTGTLPAEDIEIDVHPIRTSGDKFLEPSSKKTYLLHHNLHKGSMPFRVAIPLKNWKLKERDAIRTGIEHLMLVGNITYKDGFGNAQETPYNFVFDRDISSGSWLPSAVGSLDEMMEKQQQHK